MFGETSCRPPKNQLTVCGFDKKIFYKKISCFQATSLGLKLCGNRLATSFQLPLRLEERVDARLPVCSKSTISFSLTIRVDWNGTKMCLLKGIYIYLFYTRTRQRTQPNMTSNMIVKKPLAAVVEGLRLKATVWPGHGLSVWRGCGRRPWLAGRRLWVGERWCGPEEGAQAWTWLSSPGILESHNSVPKLHDLIQAGSSNGRIILPAGVEWGGTQKKRQGKTIDVLTPEATTHMSLFIRLMYRTTVPINGLVTWLGLFEAVECFKGQMKNLVDSVCSVDRVFIYLIKMLVSSSSLQNPIYKTKHLLLFCIMSQFKFN